ncbi:hypothetical protein OSB04_010364 [Centaurea solstitialis]|uniref:Lipoxygenase n=1 Tax=Centaurea solstitialis TaxID=347529 RepID=A0AA38T7E5_9ASTR|nr:hypothetical protein OSB04_010364 [Centaurea solstitialis]
MLSSQITQSHSIQNLLPLQKPFIGGDATNHSASAAYSPVMLTTTKRSSAGGTRTKSVGSIKAISLTDLFPKTTAVKGVISIQPTISSALDGVVGAGFDIGLDLLGFSFLIELVSVDLDSKGNLKTVKDFARYDALDSLSGVYKYKCNFDIPADFGEIGAVLVENEYSKKMFFKDIVLNNDVTFTCESWVCSKYDNPEKRIFFTNKSYLPSETPAALKSLREKDLASLRGNGTGERKSHDRIYDYDVYNDLGSPDQNISLARPVLGGEEHPYPRRCRTGRKMSSKDPLTESRTLLPFYVPADEDFSEIKEATFGARALYSVLHAVLPILDSVFTDKDKGFPLFTSIDLLYNEGVNVPNPDNGILSVLPRLVKSATDATNTVIKFETPETIDRDTFSWFRDEEFCRQTLAGLNPMNIELVTEWPLMSKLDPEVYGPAESGITKEIVEQEIKGFMTFEEALAQKKLFLLDYHDILLPYVNKTREIPGTTLYGSRTLMFLTPVGTLRPLAIELTRPPVDGKPQWKHVYTPCWDATGAWLWKLAKAHVLAHDSGIHQLVSHWLRTHCCTEPYIIATNRHLSQMHPIRRLLLPHFRYTMQINALARLALVNANGIIESSFSPRKYSMELCSDAYDQLWRFDHEALPNNLISRGMAVEDPTAPHGLKLTIEDYPFANDGLLIWDAIKEWATTYVNRYYPQASLIESDVELNAWWDEIRTVGHGDKKDEPWWPQLKTQEDLIQIVSTIMWVTSGHHSAVNFGQYDFAGYFPNRPTIARTKMPNEDPIDEEWQTFLKRPEDFLLKCFPSQIQATQVMSVLDVLSSHSPEEEYIGAKLEPAWEADPTIKAAFEEFRAKLNTFEGIIDSRNTDYKLLNRSGAGLVPYQLLKPYSDHGVTGKENKLSSQINQSPSIQNRLPLQKPFISGDTTNHSSFAAYSPVILTTTKMSKANGTRTTSAGSIKAISLSGIFSKTTTVKGVVTIQPTISSTLDGIGVGGIVDTISDFLGRSFLIELTVKDYARYDLLDFGSSVYRYKCNFEVLTDFGEIGAVLVENEYTKKMFFNDIVINNDITFMCNSWVHSKFDNPEKRIFFTNKSYLPSETPTALKSLREQDLASLRGNGTGERKSHERIYDYDVYNDLGSPDKNISLARPVLGGEKHPYPRRCRTGRKMSTKDPLTESRTLLPFYIPVDEDFSEIKEVTFGARTLFSVLHAVLPTLDSALTDKEKGFPLFTTIDLLFNEGVNVPPHDKGLLSVLPRLIKGVADTANSVIQFETPETIDRDTFSWFRDEEFCRQMLAGLNPLNIQLVTEWPLMSKLDPEVYGPAESHITKKIVEQEIRGFMTLEEALVQKKLFLLDYHDILLPHVNKTREIPGTTLYGSRTLMFLTPTGTLRPLAIELTRPPIDGKPQWKHVYTPCWDATGAWLWKLAKAQVLAHDSGVHQLVSHWLRTHCCTEPYIIATNRHLSQMHPIQRLLAPHFRYTMQINALARLALINADGIIESSFSPRKYSMQLCSDAYDQLWRFDHEALPNDLISSGNATNHSSSAAYSPVILTTTKKSNTTHSRSTSAGIVRAITLPSILTKPTVKGVITIQPTISSAIAGAGLGGAIDVIKDIAGRSFLIELVYKYKCNFNVPKDFGEIGAVLVQNEYSKMMFFKDIVLDNDVKFSCDSWVHSKSDNPEKRIFFTNKSYLPSETPAALKSLREQDLASLRGNGKGERTSYERIYDYDVYNDLGSPDDNISLVRPVLGGEEQPYPRRCRTGRKMSSKDPLTESRTSLPFYVPADEDFSEIKEVTFGARTLYSVLHAVLPTLDATLTDKEKGFPLFTAIDLLFNEGINVPPPDKTLLSVLPGLIKGATDTVNTVIRFETPETIDRDTFSWFRDEEFCRQMLAGLNPISIQLVTEWPLMSKLDPEVYGPAESGITKEIVEQEIRGFMTLEEALAQKKLFLLDYHDLLLPYVNKTREIPGTTLYGSRTLMFLTPSGTLRPLAIELTRPPVDGKPQWKHVYTPCWDATGAWLWKLAKAHVLAHDSGIHQLISHWLRTHCCTEPYIIATNRHLSQMHPIRRLLLPHFRYTMQINALARLALINADGIIESSFSLLENIVCNFPLTFMIKGMAVEDPTAPHGLKLTIEDYPFANDGLLIWDAIKEWATTYVNHYYPQASLIESDVELNAWWDEIRTVGHGDKKDETWWPQLKTQEDLIQIVSTIIWVTSGHHSAVNFGQYDFAGYFPNRPTIARTKMPNEEPTDEEWQTFLKRPEDLLLKSFPSQIQATKVMSVLNVLSSHSPEEEYIGAKPEPAWEADSTIKAAFEEFRAKLDNLESIIDSRNTDYKLLNRSGAGLVPYQLLKPYSGSGVTGKGVPNSISIYKKDGIRIIKFIRHEFHQRVSSNILDDSTTNTCIGDCGAYGWVDGDSSYKI